MRRARPAALVALLGGCTFTPGGPMSTLAEVRVTGGVASEELALEDGRTVSLETAEVLLGTVTLQRLASGGGGGSFDPASPPEGFSLCHNGHCHYEDGSLWTYGEIEVWLAGDSASWVDVAAIAHEEGFEEDDVAVHVGIDLLEPEDVVIFEGPLGLESGDLGRVHLDGVLTLGGHLHEGGESTRLAVFAPLSEGLVGNLDVTVDRDLPEVVAVEASWTLPEDLFAGAELAVEEGEPLLLDGEDGDSALVVEAAEAALLEADLVEG